MLAYVVLCYGITWPIWFAVPLIAGSNWTMGKMVTGAGFGPALAAIVLDRVLGTGGKIGTGKWWAYFTIVFVVVALLDLSSLITG
ncbi:MAG: hypothetical protein WBW61_01870, partial [Rhodanobacteraceae bacterium]